MTGRHPEETSQASVHGECPKARRPASHDPAGSSLLAVVKPQSSLGRISGRSGRIRTCDPLLPKQMRYQAALRSDQAGLIGMAMPAPQSLAAPTARNLSRRC